MILHVTTEAEWVKQTNNEYFVASSLSTEGFIHACTEEQLPGVLERYFAGKTDLIILTIEEKKLSPQIKFEKSLTGEMFPHIFGPINRVAIVSVKRL